MRRTRDKKSPGRCWFVEITQEEDGARFVFVDETSTNLTHARRYGRSPARTCEAQEAVVQTATDWITERDVKNGFDHCGYPRTSIGESL